MTAIFVWPPSWKYVFFQMPLFLNFIRVGWRITMQSLLLLLKSAQFGYFVCLIRCTTFVDRSDSGDLLLVILLHLWPYCWPGTSINLAIFVSFAVFIHTLISKQPPPSPLPLLTPSVTTATVYLPKCQITCLQQIQNSLALAVVKATKSSHITPIIQSLHWLKITERIEYKILSLTYKVLMITQPLYLHKLITFQPPCHTRSSSLVTLIHLSTSSFV